MTKFSILLLSLVASTCCAQSYSLITVAGSGSASNNGDAGAALETNINQTFGVEVGPDDALYICEVGHHRVRRLDRTTGKVTSVAGNGKQGYSGDGGPATDAALNEPYEIRFDRDGNMYLVEMKNHIVRRVDAKTKNITTIAGTGEAGFSGDGGPATEAQFSRPHSIALSADAASDSGFLYIADIGNHRIRRIDLKTGIVTTIAGDGSKKLPRNGEAASGNPVVGPRALFVRDNTLWVALREGHSIWKIDLTDGRWQHIAGTGKQGYSGDGGPATEATFNGPKGIAVDAAGDLYIVDTENQAIRKITTKTGKISTIAGKATSAKLARPHGVCVDADGNIYIGDTNNHRVCELRIAN